MATPGRTRLPRAEREQQTLDVAHRMFAERGYGAVTMDDVAAEVGVTKPLLYAYFGNKERLYLACLDRSGEALLTMLAGALTEVRTPADGLALGVRAFFDFVDSDSDAWRVLFDETLPASGEIARRVGEYRDRLTELVAGALVARVPADRGAAAVEVEALSTALLGASEAMARWWLRTGAMPAAEAAELLISTVEPGLRARSRPTSTGGAA